MPQIGGGYDLFRLMAGGLMQPHNVVHTILYLLCMCVVVVMRCLRWYFTIGRLVCWYKRLVTAEFARNIWLEKGQLTTFRKHLLLTGNRLNQIMTLKCSTWEIRSKHNNIFPMSGNSGSPLCIIKKSFQSRYLPFNKSVTTWKALIYMGLISYQITDTVSVFFFFSGDTPLY